MTDERDLRRVELKAIFLDSENDTYVILLRDQLSLHVVPIGVWQAEAASIMVKIQGGSYPRPLSHDLIQRILHSLAGTLERVVISTVEDGVFHTTLYIRTARNEVKKIDARPSDSIALALRTDSPVYITEDVFQRAAIKPPAYEQADFDYFVDSEFNLSDFRHYLN